MESKSVKKELKLLPQYFKKIGILVMILSFATAVIVKSRYADLLQSQKDLFRVFTLNAFILGLFFIAWSKDKIEDEMIIAIRYKAMAWTFSFVVIYVIVSPIVDLFFNGPERILSSQQVVMSMLFSYLIMYYLQKIKR